jgi:hypothetical protein
VAVVWGEHPGPGPEPDADLGFPRVRAAVAPAPYDAHARTEYRHHQPGYPAFVANHRTDLGPMPLTGLSAIVANPSIVNWGLSFRT